MGLEVLGCTLEQDAISWGSSSIASPRNRAEAKDRLAAIVAGPLSEGERMWPSERERVGSGDLASAARLMGVWDLTLVDYIEAERVAEVMLADHADDLSRLTDELLRRRSLSGDEVRVILSA